MKYYRFRNGVFIKAKSFEEAKLALIRQILDEEENELRWHKCTCIGIIHRIGCPESNDEIPF